MLSETLMVAQKGGYWAAPTAASRAASKADSSAARTVVQMVDCWVEKRGELSELLSETVTVALRGYYLAVPTAVLRAALTVHSSVARKAAKMAGYWAEQTDELSALWSEQ